MTYIQVDEVRIPNVTGSKLADARRVLTQQGFEVSTYADKHTNAPADTVTSQTPAAEATVRQGRGVALGISKEPLLVMPNLKGAAEADAKSTLSRLGIDLQALTYAHSALPAGQVLLQQPAKGTEGSTLKARLAVSLGPQSEVVSVPELKGMTPDKAKETLSALGFRRVELVPSKLGKPNVVLQDPKAGARIDVSAPVTVYYDVKNKQVIRIPDVKGLALQQAIGSLQASGLRVGEVTSKPFDASKPRGVLSYYPEGYTLWGADVELVTNGEPGRFTVGQPLLPGAPATAIPKPNVGVIIAGGVPEAPAQPTQPPVIGAAEQRTLNLPGGREVPIFYDPNNYAFLKDRPYQFKVEVTDTQGSRVALERNMPANQAVQDTIVIYGKTELRMFIDGQIVLVYNPTTQ